MKHFFVRNPQKMYAAIIFTAIGILIYSAIALSMHNQCTGCSKATQMKNFFLVFIILSSVAIVGAISKFVYDAVTSEGASLLARAGGGIPGEATLFFVFAGMLTFSAMALKMHDECDDCSKASQLKNFFLASAIASAGGILAMYGLGAYRMGKRTCPETLTPIETPTFF